MPDPKLKAPVRMASMTSSGKRNAALIGIALAFFLPKQVPCGVPDLACPAREGPHHRMCTPYELEPLGFYAIEWVVHRNVGFAYVSDQDCP